MSLPHTTPDHPRRRKPLIVVIHPPTTATPPPPHSLHRLKHSTAHRPSTVQIQKPTAVTCILNPCGLYPTGPIIPCGKMGHIWAPPYGHDGTAIGSLRAIDSESVTKVDRSLNKTQSIGHRLYVSLRTAIVRWTHCKGLPGTAG